MRTAMEQYADGLRHGSVTAEPVAVAVVLEHAWHTCEEGQNKADCGARYGSEGWPDAATFEFTRCVVCLDLANLPCGE
jgi:hypothetical protein